MPDECDEISLRYLSCDFHDGIIFLFIMFPNAIYVYLCKSIEDLFAMNIEYHHKRNLFFRLTTLTGLLIMFFVISHCSDGPEEDSSGTYLNHNDTVKYAGIEKCKICHYDHYQTYIHTGMGMSFDSATRQKSAAVLGKDSIIYDARHDLYYHPFWSADSTLHVREYRLKNGDTVYSRVQYVTHIVGSGQHTNSHMYNSNGYFYQIPFTFYTQQGVLDFPPGFEHGENSRFSRIIGLECISCHNDLPEMVLGSENKYTAMPHGITCERCHGPGEVHVQRMQAGKQTDTAKRPDYSIVNPARLSAKLVNDICARCHLQGTTVLKSGKNYYDFKPGMLMSDVMDVFQPWYEGGKESFIMASHYERMTLSKCYLESGQKLRCIDCHNPHISHTQTPDSQFNKSCLKCHQEGRNFCTLPREQRGEDDCVKCHIRLSTTEDIPHVRIHDHKISIPPTAKTLAQKRVFKGLKAFNEWDADSLTMAMGYLREYESYTYQKSYLDSAFAYLQQKNVADEDYAFNAWVNYYFLRQDYAALTRKVEETGIEKVLNEYLTEQNYNNADAWAAYRTGQAFDYQHRNLLALKFYQRAVKLTPYSLKFRNKLGMMLIKMNRLEQAKKNLEFALREDTLFEQTYVNLGYLYMLEHQREKAKKLYERVLGLNPDHFQALINLAGVYYLEGKKSKAKALLLRARKLSPGNPQVKQMLQQLN